MNWLIAQRNPLEAPSCFGSWIPKGETASQRKTRSREATRIAWCYGDLGAGMGLLQGALGAGDSAMAEEALSICRTAATRPMAHAGAVDASLCHGHAGNAHVFHRPTLPGHRRRDLPGGMPVLP